MGLTLLGSSKVSAPVRLDAIGAWAAGGGEWPIAHR